MPSEALAVAVAWGYEPKTELVWRKMTKDGTGLAMGMGHYVRGAHETCVIATRGKCPPAIRTVRSVFDAPRGRHSEKPDAFYHIVDAMYPGSKKYELFARKRRYGYEQYGDQLEEI